MTQFNYTFLVCKKTIFEVNNAEIANNPYFATSAAVFNNTNTDFNRCGQCQDDTLPPGPARDFWQKWDVLHLAHLNLNQEEEILQDIEALKLKYKWIPSCSFSEQQKLVRNK